MRPADVVLTQWTDHVQRIADALRTENLHPAVLVGGIGVRARKTSPRRPGCRPGRAAAPARGNSPYIGEGFDCPALDALFLAAPITSRGRLVQYVGRVLCPYPGKTTAEVHDYQDENTGVLAPSLAKRAPGDTSLGFTDPRQLAR